jgi:hypothetical protein
VVSPPNFESDLFNNKGQHLILKFLPRKNVVSSLSKKYLLRFPYNWFSKILPNVNCIHVKGGNLVTVVYLELKNVIIHKAVNSIYSDGGLNKHI